MVDVKAETNGHVDLTGVQIDPAKLKLRELVEIETLLGRRVAADLMTGMLGADMMQALLWVALRRRNPELTFEDAGEVGFDQVAEMLEAVDGDAEGDAVDPPIPPSGGETAADSPAAGSSKASRSSAASTG